MFKPERYKDIFNQRAGSYHGAMQAWPAARDEEFATILSLADIEARHRVVDMFAGGGYLSWYLPPEQELYHFETSSVFADFGRSGTSHPIVLVNDAGLPFPDDCFDRFVSLAGLHHIDDKAPVYREMARVLKPGGIAVIADAHEDSNVARFLDECVGCFNPMGHSGVYLSDATLDEVTATGLDILSSETLHYHWRCPTAADMAGYCRQLFGMTLGDEQEIERGIEHHLGPIEENGAARMNWNLHFIKIRKHAPAA